MSSLLNSIQSGFDVLSFVDLFPSQFRTLGYKVFWKWRYRLFIRLAKSKIDLSTNSYDWHALRFTAKEALEAAVTDLWRQHLFATKSSSSRMMQRSWLNRARKRLPLYLATLVKCLDSLIAITDADKFFGSAERSLLFQMVSFTSGERGSLRNPHLRWPDRALAGKLITINSVLSIPYVELMSVNPQITYSLTFDLLDQIKRCVPFSPGREVAVVLVEGLLNDCLIWCKNSDNANPLPELNVFDIDYFVDSACNKNPAAKADELFQKAIICHKLDREKRALSLLALSVQADAGHISAWLQRSIIFHDMNRRLAPFRQLASNFDVDEDPLEPSESQVLDQDSLDMAIANATGRPEAYFEIGLHYYLSLADNEKAVEIFSEAISLAPSTGKYFCMRGAALRALEKFPESLSDLDKAIELDPTDKYAYWHRAVVYQNFKCDLDSAHADLTTAISLDKEWTPGYITRSEIYYEQNKFDLAMADLEALIRIEPNEQKWVDATERLQQVISDQHQPASTFAK